MKKQKVVAFKQLPSRFPLVQSLTAWLFLDRIQAQGWIWGVVGTFFTLFWLLAIIGVFNQEQVEVIKE